MGEIFVYFTFGNDFFMDFTTSHLTSKTFRPIKPEKKIFKTGFKIYVFSTKYMQDIRNERKLYI